MAKSIPLFSQGEPRPLAEPVRVTEYHIVGPWQIEAHEAEIREIPAGCAFLRTRYTGICHADIRYISGSRPDAVMRERLPLVPFHEGCAEVVETGPEVHGLRQGQKVCVVPNLPCHVQDPRTYPSKEQACPACRPGGPGESFCADVAFLASNVHGMARSHLIHPAAALVALPEDCPEQLAPMAEPLSVVYRAACRGDVRGAQRAAVLGAGVMGHLLALVLAHHFKTPTERMLITDIYEDRLQRVCDLGQTLNTRSDLIPEEFAHRFDRAFECAGGHACDSTIEQALQLLKPGGVCVLIGVSADPVPVRTRTMLDKGLALMGTTRSAAEDYGPVLGLLSRPEFQRALRPLIHEKTFSGDSAQSLLDAARVAADPGTPGKVIVDWTQ